MGEMRRVVIQDEASVLRIGTRHMEIANPEGIQLEVEARTLARLVLADVMKFEGDDFRNSVGVQWFDPLAEPAAPTTPSLLRRLLNALGFAAADRRRQEGA